MQTKSPDIHGSFEVVLPWPNPALGLNGRLPRYAHARLFKNVKEQTFFLTKKALCGEIPQIPPKTLVNIQLVCTPPVLRYRDEDNFIGNCKAVFDGISMAINVDDCYFHLLEQVWNRPQKPGNLKVVVSWKGEPYA